MYEERAYRDLVKTEDLVRFKIIVKETDLLVRAERYLERSQRIGVKISSSTGNLYCDES